jgi:hypothetical protein
VQKVTPTPAGIVFRDGLEHWYFGEPQITGMEPGRKQGLFVDRGILPGSRSLRDREEAVS